MLDLQPASNAFAQSGNALHAQRQRRMRVGASRPAAHLSPLRLDMASSHGCKHARSS